MGIKGLGVGLIEPVRAWALAISVALPSLSFLCRILRLKLASVDIKDRLCKPENMLTTCSEGLAVCVGVQ